MVFDKYFVHTCSWQKPGGGDRKLGKRHWRNSSNNMRMRETHEDLLSVITDEMSYAIHPDLDFDGPPERAVRQASARGLFRASVGY